MAYRLAYQINVFWVGPGLGPMGGGLAPTLPGAPAGGAQVFEVLNTQGGQNSNTFLSADITAMTNAMAADVSAQLNAPATLARIQGFASGLG